MLFLVHKVIRNRSIWGPCQFLIFVTKHLVKNIPIYLSGNMKESICKKSGKVKNLYGNAKDFEKQNEKHMEKWWIWLKKWKNLYGKNMEMWRICMEMWRIFKEKWNIYGKNDEFVWKSERKVQRYSKYRFFDVNCILRYSKYRFSSSIPGMPGEAKISIPYSMWVEDLIYIHVVMSWDVLSVGGLHSWLITVVFI